MLPFRNIEERLGGGAGDLEQVRPAPAGRGPALRAELGGEAGRLTIIWLGRTHITGIEPGRVLAVEGTLSRQRGRKVMYNPRYELLAPQARAGHRRSP